MLREDEAPRQEALLIGRQLRSGGRLLCRERNVYWRYDLPTELTTELKRKGNRRGICTITINLLELLGIVVTAWVMLELEVTRPRPTATRSRCAAITWRQCRG